jgi:hypothetical protein
MAAASMSDARMVFFIYSRSVRYSLICGESGSFA